MTPEQIKEQLSIHYLGALVSTAGHHLELPTLPASGVDVMITEVFQFQLEGKTRFADMGNTIDIQIKCTTEKRASIVEKKKGNKVLKFDLEAKNFNDLILRLRHLNSRRVKPLLLIVLILPDNKSKWVNLFINDDRQEKFLQLGGAAYWFYPEDADNFTPNKRQVRIEIPLKNKVDLKFLKSIFSSF